MGEGHIGIRLCQTLMATVYLFSGIHKLRSQSWFENPTALFQILNHIPSATLSLDWSQFSGALAICTQGVIVFEILIPFLLFTRRFYKIALMILATLHIIWAATLNISLFFHSSCLGGSTASASALYNGKNRPSNSMRF